MNNFLLCKTPQSWLSKANDNLKTLLIDHAHCEKKAASSALHIMYKYGQDTALCMQLSKLAREELRHFEMVLAWLKKRSIRFIPLKSGGYASSLRQHIHTQDNRQYLIDICIINALIEARSCERFAVVSAILEPKLAAFYQKLYASEERHFLLYLNLAVHYGSDKIQSRIDFFRQQEACFITTEDNLFRFHSGA